jgi:GH15 family glucan-1,4-alpha-glucosidase
MSSEAISNYALLSDCSSAALLSAAGSVDWLCFPRFDSPSVFGRLLGQDAGFWSICPSAGHTSARRYVGPAMVLESTHTAPEGSIAVTDALALGDGKRGHDLGAGSPGTLIRQVSCTAGTVDVDVVYSPRPEYGLAAPVLDTVDGGILLRTGAAVLSLSTPVAFRPGQRRPGDRQRRAARRRRVAAEQCRP